MKNRMRWIWAGALIAAVGLTAWGVSRYEKGPGAISPAAGGGMAMPVEAAPVTVGSVPLEIDTVGSLQANESVLIRSEIAGRVAAIHLSEGQNISKEALLVSVDASEYQAQFNQITAVDELNRLNFDRARQLFQEQLISQQAYDEIAAKLQESQASLSLARVRLDKTAIRAPFSGRLGLRQISPGDYLQPGQAIVNLEDISAMKVDFRVPEIYSGRIKVGQTLSAAVDAFPDKRFSGRVDAVDPRMDEATRTILVRGRVPNPGGELRPGMFARVTLELGERRNAPLAPEEALVPMGQEKFVFRVVDGKASLTPVEIGRRLEGKVEIVKGLSADDVVITGGQMKIFDGAPVMVVPPSRKEEAPAPQRPAP